MRLLVYPHDLGIGGSQINAIDLAARAQRAGHEVLVYGVDGPLRSYVTALGLRFIAAHPLKYRPAPSRVAQLAWLAKRERVDLIHAYEWPPCLDAYFGAGLLLRVPILCTVLSMSVSTLVPGTLPLVMGTEELGEKARVGRPGPVFVVEPPIDVEQDHPGIDGRSFRHVHGVSADELLIVTVSRLALDLKLDALVRAIDATSEIAARHRARLVIVGDGPAKQALAARAAAVNRKYGCEVVRLIGAMLDPRAAYAAADLVVGMGSSVLRAMAIGRPVIVQGEDAFSEIFEPETYDMFLRQGLYGLSDGAQDVRRLTSQIDALLRDPARRRVLGAFGRKVVEDRFSLSRAEKIYLDLYEKIQDTPPAWHLGDIARSIEGALAQEIVNHDPRRKRKRKAREEAYLAAARSEVWPPLSAGSG